MDRQLININWIPPRIALPELRFHYKKVDLNDMSIKNPVGGINVDPNEIPGSLIRFYTSAGSWFFKAYQFKKHRFNC